MTATYPMILSITEPNNNVGMVKVRKYDAGTQVFDVTITENGRPKDFTGLTPFFCVKSSPKTGLGISEQIVTDVVDEKNGRLKYTLRDYDMQHPQTNHAYFAFKKLNDGETFELQFTTKDFRYTTIASIFDPGIHDSNYIWTFEEMLRIFREWIEITKEEFAEWNAEAKAEILKIIEEFKSWISENQADFDKWLQENKESWSSWVESCREILEDIDPGGKILTELIDARTNDDGETFSSLSERLNDADKSHVKKKNVEINLSDYLTSNQKDNLVNFQKAIDDLPDSGGTILIPHRQGNLQLSGSNPDFPDHQIVIDKPNVTIKGLTSGHVSYEEQFIEPMTNGLISVFYLTNNAVNFKKISVGLSLKKRVDYGIFSEDFISRGFIFDVRVFDARKSAFNLCAYLTTIQRCEAHTFGESGFKISGNQKQRVQGTSIQLLNCYALGVGGIGYDLSLLTYSSILTCAVDHTTIGYKLAECFGISIGGCGAENCIRPVVLDKCQSISFPNISIPTLPSETIESVIELNDSRNIKIGGMYINGVKPKFTYKVTLNGGSSCVIEDRTIDTPEINNQSTLTTNAYTHLGYVVSSIRKTPFTQPFIADTGVTGELKVLKDNLEIVEINAEITVTDKSKAKRIAQLPAGHYPLKNAPLETISLNTGKRILNGFYVTAQGGIYAVQDGDINEGTNYAVTGRFNGY